MALTKANTKGKVRRPQVQPPQVAPQPPLPPWGGIDIPSQSPAPGFNFGGGVGATSPASNPWAGLGALFAPQQQSPGIDFAKLFGAMRNDPVHDQNSAYNAGVSGPANPFSNGFFNDTAASMSPEARVASQGRSATNQWAQLGGVPGVDPEKLKNIMGGMTPTSGPQATPQETFSDPFFMRKQKLGPYTPDNTIGNPTPIPANGMTPFGPVGPDASLLPPGTIAGDGTTNYKRSPQLDPAMLLRMLQSIGIGSLG